jgi:hypothetical protein
MKKRRLLYFLLAEILMAACSNPEKPAAPAEPAAKTPELMQPFRYHKLVEVSPGQDYDVVSWGRGSTKTGAFAILHSDSAAAKFVTTTGDLVGAIVDVFNTDMDLDGNPEIIIQAKGNDTLNYTNMYAFEFTDGHAEKLDFPRLTKPQRQGYRGEDNFYVQEGKLYREFPLFDAGAKPTGQKRQLEYGLRDNSFTVKQVTRDSTNVSSPAKAAPVQKQEGPKHEKHSSETRHKKRHHRRHHEEE